MLYLATEEKKLYPKNFKGKRGIYGILLSDFKIDDYGKKQYYTVLKVGWGKDLESRLNDYKSYTAGFYIRFVITDELLTRPDEIRFHSVFSEYRDVERINGEIVYDPSGNPKLKQEMYRYDEDHEEDCVVLNFFKTHTTANNIRLAIDPAKMLTEEYDLDDKERKSIAKYYLTLDSSRKSDNDYTLYPEKDICRAEDLLRACKYRHIYRNGDDSVFLDSLSSFHKEYIKYDPEINKNLPLTIAMLTAGEVEEIRIILSNSHNPLCSYSLRYTWIHNIFCILVRAYTRLRGLQSDPMCNIDAELNDKINKSLPKALYLK